MKGFNWKWLVVPFVPTVTVLHAHWLCYLMDANWGTPGHHLFVGLMSFVMTCFAAGWASQWKGW